MVRYCLDIRGQITFEASEEQIPTGPLIDPVLQGTTFLLHHRAGPHMCPASLTQVTVFLIDSCQVCLHCGVGHGVGWSVDHVNREHAVERSGDQDHLILWRLNGNHLCPWNYSHSLQGGAKVFYSSRLGGEYFTIFTSQILNSTVLWRGKGQATKIKMHWFGLLVKTFFFN